MSRFHIRNRNARSTKKRLPFYGSPKWRKFSAQVVKAWKAAEYGCGLCGTELAPGARVDVDHITPLSEGGAALDPANVRVVHHGCHSRHTAAERDAKARGFRLGSLDDGLPADPNHPFNREEN